MLETITANKNIIYPEYTNTRIQNFDTRWLQMKWIFFVDPKKKTPFIIARELRVNIAENLKKYGIEIPYAHIAITTEE